MHKTTPIPLRRKSSRRFRLTALRPIAALSLLTAALYLLLNTSLLATIGRAAHAATQQPAIARQALAYQSALFDEPVDPDVCDAITLQSASVASWLELAPTAVTTPADGAWTPPNLPVRLPSATSETTAPQSSDPPAQPAVATPFVPNLNADKIREGTFVPTSTEGYTYYKDVYIKNISGYKVDVKKLSEQRLKLSLAAGKPQILIVHTHGSESYFPDQENWYEPTDVERTEDKNFNVIRIGDELEKVFTARGFVVLHDRNIYDYPTYTGSYNRSLDSITRYINDNPSIAMVIDLHRDSINNDAGNIYKAVTSVDGQKVAQLMLVMGSDGNGQPFPNWRDNLALAVQLNQALAEKYPQLMRPMSLRKGRYNEHATTGSILLEVGAFGNSLPEALRAIRLFGNTAADLLQPYVD